MKHADPLDASLVPPTLADAAAGRLVDRYWDDLLHLDPLLGTSVGDERYDDVLPDLSAHGLAQREAVHARALREAQAIPRDQLTPVHRQALDVVESFAGAQVSALVNGLPYLDAVDHLDGPVGLVDHLGVVQPAETAEQRARLVTRLRLFPRYFAAVAELMREGAERRVTMPKLVVGHTIDQATRLLELPCDRWPVMTNRAAWRADEVDRLRAAIDEAARPAYADYLQALRSYRAAARQGPGLCHLDSGGAIYTTYMQRWLGRPVAPRELYETGEAELEHLGERRSAVIGQLGGRSAASAIEAYEADAGTRLRQRDDFISFVAQFVERASVVAPRYFGRQPVARLEVRLVESSREEHLPGAYYEAPGGSDRPGLYFVNPFFYRTGEGTIHRLATTTYHEAVPGHHFQVALDLERSDAPALRRFAGTLGGHVFGEGWGLYAERLAQEIGLFVHPVEELGFLDNDALRAVRLVVDTGIHAFGWSRKHAVEKMRSVGLPQHEAEVEVDRYCATPAQALTYKVGQLQILEWRATMAPSGEANELRAFHDRLLSLGSLPIAALERELRSQVGSAQVAGSGP